VTTALDSVTMTSPGFPEQYPDNAFCTMETFGYLGVGIQTVVTANTFRLRKNDYLEIENPYTPPIRISGNKKGGRVWKVPSSTVRATFTSDNSLTKEGFNVTFTGIPYNEECGGLSTYGMPASSNGSIYTSRYPKKHGNNLYCEWLIMAYTPGKKVKVTFSNIKDLRKNKVYINPTTSQYYNDGVQMLTGKVSQPVEIVSEGQGMRIFYEGKRKNRGFQLDYEEV